MLDDASLCLSIGQRLGHFFADLHSKSALEAVEKTMGNDTELVRFKNESMKDVVRDAAVAPLKGYLDRFDILDSAELSRVVYEDFERGTELDGERAFNIGDPWPGDVLIEQRERTDKVHVAEGPDAKVR